MHSQSQPEKEPERQPENRAPYGEILYGKEQLDAITRHIEEGPFLGERMVAFCDGECDRDG